MSVSIITSVVIPAPGGAGHIRNRVAVSIITNVILAPPREEAALDFVSVVYARPGAASHGWHAEGRDPDVGPAEGSGEDGLRSMILKIQVLLVFLASEEAAEGAGGAGGAGDQRPAAGHRYRYLVV